MMSLMCLILALDFLFACPLEASLDSFPRFSVANISHKIDNSGGRSYVISPSLCEKIIQINVWLYMNTDDH